MSNSDEVHIKHVEEPESWYELEDKINTSSPLKPNSNDKFHSSIEMKTMRSYEKKGKLKSSSHPFHNLSIWNYQEVVHYKDSWDMITLSARALVVESDTGKIIGRALPKFFNHGENKHKPTENFRIFNKMDGSLFILFFYRGEWVTASRGSFISEQAVEGRKILEELYPRYTELIQNFTYVFELIYPENRIVVNYGDERKLIYLTSFNTTGNENMMVDCMKELGFEVVREFDFNDKTLDELADLNISNSEGFVVLYDNGDRVKVKFEDYLKLHRTATNFSNKIIFEKYSSGLSLDECLVDVPDEFNEWLRGGFKDLDDKKIELELEARELFESIKNLDRKDFYAKIDNHHLKKVINALYNNKDIVPVLKTLISSKDIKTKGVGFSSKPLTKKQSVMIFLIGCSGTGKSTWVKKFINGRKDCVVVNRDTLRISLFCLNDQRDVTSYYESPNIKNCEKTISSVVRSIIIEALKEDKTIIMDNTNLDRKFLEEELKLVLTDTLIRYEVFEPAETIEIQHERTKNRNTGYEVPKSIIRKQLNSFNALRPQLLEIFSKKLESNKIIQNEQLPNVVIFDIDGTLALNTGGRSPYDMGRVSEDSPNNHIIRAAQMHVNSGIPVVICSGREECGRKATEEWLVNHMISFDELHMRSNKDMRKDYIVKEEFWRDICTRWYITNMYDDRDQVVNHARKLGFNICQVAEGNF